jgi:hypothetical protein
MIWNSKKLAQLIRGAIVENTLAGFDKDGKPFDKYSDKPFAMPHGAVANKAKLKKAIAESKRLVKASSDPIVKVFQKDGGSHWITWMGGYKDYKKIMYTESKTVNMAGSSVTVSPSATVNLFATGGMLKSFGVLKTIEKYKQDTIFDNQKITLPVPEVRITLGWQSTIEGDKAFYNIKRGRNMLGLPQKKLNNLVGGFIKVHIAGV